MTSFTIPHSDGDNSFPGSPSVSPADATPASPLLCSPPLAWLLPAMASSYRPASSSSSRFAPPDSGLSAHPKPSSGPQASSINQYSHVFLPIPPPSPIPNPHFPTTPTHIHHALICFLYHPVSVCLTVCLSVYLSICLSVYLSVLLACLSVYRLSFLFLFFFHYSLLLFISFYFPLLFPSSVSSKVHAILPFSSSSPLVNSFLLSASCRMSIYQATASLAWTTTRGITSKLTHGPWRWTIRPLSDRMERETSRPCKPAVTLTINR